MNKGLSFHLEEEGDHGQGRVTKEWGRYKEVNKGDEGKEVWKREKKATECLKGMTQS